MKKIKQQKLKAIKENSGSKVIDYKPTFNKLE